MWESTSRSICADIVLARYAKDMGRNGDLLPFRARH